MASGYKKKPLALKIPEMNFGKGYGRSTGKPGDVKILVRDGVKLEEPVVEKVGFKELRASKLRRECSHSEDVFGSMLREWGVTGFLQSVPMFGYYADFYLPALALIIEIDGPHHSRQRAYDAHRDSVFRDNGIEVIRIRVQQLRNRELVRAILVKGGVLGE